MVNVGSSPIRRPPPADDEREINLDPNEALLDEFYAAEPLHERNTREEPLRPPIAIEEYDDSFDFAHHDHHNNFRRRRVEYGDNSSSDISHEQQHLLSRKYNTSNTPQHHLQQQQLPTPTSSNKSSHDNRHLTWNRLNATLFIGQALLSAATTTPITLVPHFALALAKQNDDETWNYSPYYNMEILEVYDENGQRKRWIPFRVRRSNNNGNQQQQTNFSSSSIFASHLTSIVTLVTAFGKFINGPLVDLVGARRMLLAYGVCMSLSLLGLRYSSSPGWAIASCAAVEFFSSVNWPANIVILGSHYGMNANTESNGRFERGLYVTSLACRCGSLLAIPLSALLIKWTGLTWRGVAGLAACAAFSGVIVFYIYLTDSPGKVHDPQNPIQMKKTQSTRSNNIPYSNVPSMNAYHPSFHTWSTPQQSTSERVKNFGSSVLHTVLPSIRVILASRVFWAVAIAHAGATMVKSSERILGTYFRDTSFGAVTEGKAGAMTVFLSLGMLGGLLVGGKAFAKAADSEQGRHNTHPHNGFGQPPPSEDAAQVGTKNMIAFFYCLSICSCYMLSFLAMPFVRRALHLPVLVLILQVLTTIGLGFGVAVQYYHIPAIVAATYGKNRGLYTAYTDGVAAFVSSVVWRIVGGAVEEGNPEVGGWAYGWAAIALLLVFCGTLMIKMVELYFVGGGWKHDAHQDRHHNEGSAEMEPLIDINTSWMDDGIQSIDTSHLREPRGLNILSASALDYIGSPGRKQSYGRKSLLVPIIDSRDEEDTAAGNGKEVDLLGVDDDGSLLFSISNEGPQSTFTDGSQIRASDTFSDVVECSKGRHEESFEL